MQNKTVHSLEPIESINERLEHYFGKFNTQAKFRVVWSSDEFENVLTDRTPEGLQLLHKEIIRRPKYSHCWNLYVLEKLTPVPVQNLAEMLGKKLSYEPLWVFQDNHGNPLPPDWDACIVVINTLTEILNHVKSQTETTAKYKMPEEKYQTREAIEQQAEAMQKVLYGNDTPLGDSLAGGNAVGFTTSKVKVN